MKNDAAEKKELPVTPNPTRPDAGVGLVCVSPCRYFDQHALERRTPAPAV